MKKVNLLLLATAIVGLGSNGVSSMYASADSVSKDVTNESHMLSATSLSVSYPDGKWGDFSTSRQPVTGQYDHQNHKVNLKVSATSTHFNAEFPTFTYNLIYKITGNETGKIYLDGQDVVMSFQGRNSVDLEFTDSGNQDKSYKVDVTCVEMLEGIYPPVLPYIKDGHAIVTK